MYACCDEHRRAAVLNHPTLNGIDYLEVLDDPSIADLPAQRILLVYCLKDAPTGLTTDNVMIAGGESVTGITAAWMAPALHPPAQCPAGVAAFLTTKLANAAKVLVVCTSVAGDFAPYTLRLVHSAGNTAPYAVTNTLEGFDPQLSSVEFSFKVGCGPYFDCAPAAAECPADLPTPPVIDYLAKDYGSFRTVMLDRLNQLLPTWGATSEADMGVVLTEVIAYVADQLSYKQDAIATEAYLMTARSRISLRRHARLVGYRVHDGANARAWVTVQVSEPVFLKGSDTVFFTYAPGMPDQPRGNEQTALATGVVVFEPMQNADLYPEHNTMQLYTWGDSNCCLPRGATEATLRGSLSHLQPGDVLILQEVVGPQTGVAADADVRHRYAVRLTDVATSDAQGNALMDALFEAGSGAAIVNAGQKSQPVTEIRWAEEDALPAPLCVSSTFVDDAGATHTLTDVSVAMGNVVLADHGLTMPAVALPAVKGSALYLPPSRNADRCRPAGRQQLPARYRPVLADSPVTQAVPLPVAGAPATSSAVALPLHGLVSLPDANGYTALRVGANDVAAWPQYVGVLASAGSVAGTFTLRVVMQLPAVANVAVLESFADMVSPSAAAAAIAAHSRLVTAKVPGGAVNPAGYPGAATMLSPQGSVALKDTNGQTYLEIGALSSLSWPPLFSVLAQGSLTTLDTFNLLLLYDSPFGPVGNVTLPVIVEQFPGVTLSTAAERFGSGAALLTVETFDEEPNPALSAYALTHVDAADAVPEISLESTLSGGTAGWRAVQDLLGDGPLDTNFVVEVETNGRATLRFGDDTNGMAPAAGTTFTARYRIGNGTAGNVGADSLTYVSGDPRILSCTNPLPAAGGVDPETNAQIRRRAPQAFLIQKRAVTMQDYANAAEQNSLVESAHAQLRWTGSWYTVFVTAEPASGGVLGKSLRKNLWQQLNAVRLVGQDLQLADPEYVSLLVGLTVCVDPQYFASDVEKALMAVLGSGTQTNGQPGFFAAGNFKLGQPVYLSRILAAVRSVAGVSSVVATQFQPQSMASTNTYLDAGELGMSASQVARLANDRSLPAHGQLILNMQGGK